MTTGVVNSIGERPKTLEGDFGNFEGFLMRRGKPNSWEGLALTIPTPFAAEAESEFFLGDDLLPFLTLAIGAALLFGTAAALIKPPEKRAEGTLERPPLGRSLIQMGIGLVATIWALATLLT